MSRTPAPDEARRAIEEAAAGARAVDFWDARPGLALILDWARARLASPYATLGEVLAGVIGRVQPVVQLPPLIGGPGSLNMLIAAVGPSGEGKGAARACALEAVNWNGRGLHQVMIGTGEGLERTFGNGVKDKELGYRVNRTQWRALFVCHEVDQLAALMARRGATLSPTLRQVYSGEDLGHGNADPERRIIISRHEYRAVAIVGVQPGRGEALLGDADGGLPQRFVWLPTTDPDIPEVAPETPRCIQWQLPRDIAHLDDDVAVMVKPEVLEVCEAATTAIVSARRARLRGDGDALDGHALYTREKVAAALALYEGRVHVSEEDWQLAGHLMSVSDWTRERIANALRQAEEQRNDARGQAEARRARIVSAAAEEDRLRKAQARILTVLRNRLGWTSQSDLRRQLRSDHRDCFPEAIERLLKDDLIAEQKTAPGHGVTGSEYAVKDG
jgi:hypothetical protein